MTDSMDITLNPLFIEFVCPGFLKIRGDIRTVQKP